MRRRWSFDNGDGERCRGVNLGRCKRSRGRGACGRRRWRSGGSVDDVDLDLKMNAADVDLGGGDNIIVRTLDGEESLDVEFAGEVKLGTMGHSDGDFRWPRAAVAGREREEGRDIGEQ